MATRVTTAESLIQKLFEMDECFRYVAVLLDGKLFARSRDGLTNASASESDKYEELLVNPTVLELVRRRGEIDCGGAKYVLIRYGNFFQYVQPITGGHISVCIEPHDGIMQAIQSIQKLLEQ